MKKRDTYPWLPWRHNEECDCKSKEVKERARIIPGLKITSASDGTAAAVAFQHVSAGFRYLECPVFQESREYLTVDACLAGYLIYGSGTGSLDIFPHLAVVIVHQVAAVIADILAEWYSHIF